MSTPTFDGTDLTTRAERQTYMPPQTRTFAGTIPGVEGVYTQANPIGAKVIRVTGLLAVAGSTAANAFSTLLGVIELLQDKQGEVASYVGTGGQTYLSSIFQSYRHGPITTGTTAVAAGAAMAEVAFTSVCQVEAVIVHTVPSNVS